MFIYFVLFTCVFLCSSSLSLFCYIEMASLTATEAALCPSAIQTAESIIVPACMFAPDRGCADDASGGEGFEDGEGTNGESADHLDLSSKVGLFINCI